MNAFPWISCIIWLPLLAGITLIMLRTSKWESLAGKTAVVASLASSLTAVLLWLTAETPESGAAFTERLTWIPTLGVDYAVGMDGLSGLMVLLTALVMPLALAASWQQYRASSPYLACLLIIQGSLFGVFTSSNFFLWFFFYEISLIPAFFLVRIWGSPGKNRSSLRFFVYSMAGSISLLVGFLALAAATGSFEFSVIAEHGRTGTLASELGSKLGWFNMPLGWLCTFVFALIFLGLAIKVPMMPFHAWLPDTYDHAPTPVTMILTGLMSKMGLYGLIRMVIPMFPYTQAQVVKVLMILVAAGIVYSALAAMGQRNLKRMLAYSSINHLGYCMLGFLSLGLITNGEMNLAIQKTAALTGLMLQMFSHGIIASVLFYFAHAMEERCGEKIMIDAHGGLRKVAPVLAGTMGIAVFASVGLPGLNGFIGEFLIFKGVFALMPLAACLAVPGLLITAVFLLSFLQKVFQGPGGASVSRFRDLSMRESILILPFLLIMVVLGFLPHLLINGLNPVINKIISSMHF
jgi:NADH-quinone oxidoreductase subunit M